MPASVSGASSVGSAVDADGEFRPNAPLAPGEEGDLFDEPHTFQLGLFGVGPKYLVLYTVSKEKHMGCQFAYFRIFMDWLQLLLLTVNPVYGWSIDGEAGWWKVVSFVQLNDFFSARGYMFFLITFYILVGLLALNVGLSVWVARSFSNNRFDHVWPIQFLRYFGLVFYQVLDIATLTLLLIALDCNYSNVPDDVRYTNQEFPEVYCWDMPHIIHTVVACLSIVVFVVMAGLMIMSEMELNPVTRNYMAVPHTRVEVISFGIKTVITIASVMLNNVKWLSIVYLLGLCLLTWVNTRWVPFVYSSLNHLRCASYASVLYSAVVLVVLAYHPGLDKHASPSEVGNYQQTLTMALLAGLLPMALVGAAACQLRLRHFHKGVLDRFSRADPSTKAKNIYRFTDAREVEIAARCCRKWVDEDTLEEGASALSEAVIKAGMTLLPNDPYMIILYSSFLIDVQGSYQSGYTQLQAAKRMSPSLLERFAIFSREQEHAQKASGAKSGESAVDLVSYVEFQRNHRLVLRAHKDALYAMRAFWSALLRSKVNFNTLSQALMRIDVTVKAAERAYRTVLQRHSGSARLVRLYGRFLESVKHDPWSAAKWFSEADRLDEEAEHTKDAMQFGGDGMDGLVGQHHRHVNLDGAAVVLINAQGIIQLANVDCHTLFGYRKNELKGKNVNLLMPPPFAERHTAYVRNYIATGAAKLIDTPSTFIALHRDRSVVSITLRVSKVSGLNEDTVFMGVMESIKMPAHEARVWLLTSGTVIAADHNFCDWLGYMQDDLLGQPAAQHMADADLLPDLLRRLKNGSRPKRPQRASTAHGSSSGAPPPLAGAIAAEGSVYSGAANSVHTSPTLAALSPLQAQWRHKFGDVLDVEMEVASGAIGSEAFLTLVLKRTTHTVPARPALRRMETNMSRAGSFGNGAPAVRPMSAPQLDDMLLVCDHKGAVLHATHSLVCALGRSKESVLQGGMDLLLPEPFARLHTAWLHELGSPLAGLTGPSLPAEPPPHSCRTGLSVCLAGQDADGDTVLLPFKLMVQQRSAGGAKVHVVRLQPMSEEQALGERRLRLKVDLTGTVLSVGEGCREELFGLDPQSLVGRSAADFIDLLRDQDLDGLAAGQEEGDLDDLPGCADGKGSGSGRNGGAGNNPNNLFAGARARSTARLLVSLARRSAAAPGMSWRVGFAPARDTAAEVQLEQLARVLGPADLQQAAGLIRRRPVPAVMTLRMTHADEPEPAYVGPSLEARARRSSMVMSPSGFQRGQPQAVQFGAMAVSEPRTPRAARPALPRPDSHVVQQQEQALQGPGSGAKSFEEELEEFARNMPGGPAAPSPSLKRAIITRHRPSKGMPDAALGAPSMVLTLPPSDDPLCAQPRSLVFELELWRADLLSGVVEVDMRGRVGKQDVHPLSPAALVLGAAPKDFPGASLAQLMPLPVGGVEALLHGRGGGGARGGLKSKPKSLGAPLDLTAMHHGDRCEIALRVQAVKRSGAPGMLYVVVRPVAPTTAQPAFKRFLTDGDDSELMTQQPVMGRDAGTTGALPLSRSATNEGFLKPQAQAVLTYGPSTRMRLGGYSSPGLPPPPQAPEATPPPRPPGNPNHVAPMPVMATGASVPTVGGPPKPPVVESIGPMRVVRAAGQSSRINDGAADAAAAAVNSEGTAQPAPQRSPGEATPLPRTSSGSSSLVSSRLQPRLSALPVAAGTAEGGVKAATAAAVADSPRGTASLLPAPERDLKEGAALVAKPRIAGPEGSGSKDLRDGRLHTWLLGVSTHASGKQASSAHNGPGEPIGSADGHELFLKGGHSSSGGGSGEDDEWQRLSSDEAQETKRGARGRRDADDRSIGGDTEATDAVSNMEDAQAAADEAGAYVTNFKDGKRFKKLLKLLTSPAALAPTKALRLNTLAVVAILLIAHTVTFVVIQMQINKQKAAVVDLNSVAMASRKVHEIAINNRVLDALYGGAYVADLDTWSNTAEGVQAIRDDQEEMMVVLKRLHHGVYLGFRKARRLPTDYGLRDLWEKPSLNMSVYYDHNDPETDMLAVNASNDEPSGSDTVSLWDAGNLILSKALDLFQNSPDWVARGINFTSLSTYRFIRANALPVVFPAYQQTLDAMVQITISTSREIANVQLILLVVEGCCLCTAACLYMWYVSQQFSMHRHRLYFIFVMIPFGLTNSLASRSIGLEEGDEEDEAPVTNIAQGQEEDGHADDAAGNGAGAGAAGHKDGGGGALPKEKKGLSFAAPAGGKDPAEGKGAIGDGEGGKAGHQSSGPGADGDSGKQLGHGAGQPQSALSALAFWRNRAKVSPGKAAGASADGKSSVPFKHGKRQLVISYRSSILLVLPFVAWGVIIIGMNAAAHIALHDMSGPIATLNVVNFVLVKHHRLFYYIMEVCNALNPSNRAYYKSMLEHEYLDMRKEYEAMLYGAAAVPNETSPHFRLAQGVLFTGGTKPSDLLYHYKDCMVGIMGDSEDCQPPDSPFYLITHNGLDVLMKHYFATIESLLQQDDAGSTVNSTEFFFVWSTGQRDIEGSLVAMSAIFLNEVVTSYSWIVTEQIVLFAISWLLAAAFVILQLRPFLSQAASEMRRVAELLCQVPQEVDAEGLVNKFVLNGGKEPPPAPALPPPKRQQTMSRGLEDIVDLVHGKAALDRRQSFAASKQAFV